MRPPLVDTLAIFSCLSELSLFEPHLHLVDANGDAVAVEIVTAINSAVHWAMRDFPNVDPALVANWAEQVAAAMQSKSTSIVSPRRYAYAALTGKICDWLRTGAGREDSMGIGQKLESWTGVSPSFQASSERKILFDQLKSTLNERDRYILVLLLQDHTSPATVASALNVSYAAAAKAIQRVKDRIAATLAGASDKGDTGRGSPQFCETKA